MLTCSTVGNTSATVCSELQCQNGGKCITAGTQNVQCSCPRGYRGQYCEQRVPSCQYFGNWTEDYNGWYFSGDSYEGSLAAWFCPSGSRPEFGYSVCENRFNHPSWSNYAYCQSLTTQRPWWIRTTQYRYPTYTRYRQTKRTDPFADVDHWLTPVVLICAVSMQTFAPFIIWMVLSRCCKHRIRNPFAIADEKEEKDIAQKYKTQLGELESRTLEPENSVMIAELRGIQQQLEEEVDQVRARRRQRDRKQQKTVKPFRVISLYCYVSFWLWMIYLIIFYAAELGQYSDLFTWLVYSAIIFVILLWIVILIESWFSAERNYIKNLSLLSSATERIESIRNTQPCVAMNAQCYHYETRTRTHTYTDANGNAQTQLETYQEMVITAFIIEQYHFTHWFDSSQTTLTDVWKVGVTKIHMELSVQFGDETTEKDFREKFERFKDKHRHRDTYVNFFVSSTVVGFKKRLAAYTDSGNKPGWISSIWFWLATIFCLGWPYRIVFNRCTTKTEYDVVKFIFTNVSTTQAIPTYPNHTPGPSSENVEDSVSRIKKNIQFILSRLTAGLSAANNDEIPIKCAVTEQHMNVPLREAHHAPRTA